MARGERAMWRRDGVPMHERRPLLLRALNRIYGNAETAEIAEAAEPVEPYSVSASSTVSAVDPHGRHS